MPAPTPLAPVIRVSHLTKHYGAQVVGSTSEINDRDVRWQRPGNQSHPLLHGAP